MLEGPFVAFGGPQRVHQTPCRASKRSESFHTFQKDGETSGRSTFRKVDLSLEEPFVGRPFSALSESVHMILHDECLIVSPMKLPIALSC